MKDELLCGGKFVLCQEESVFPLSMDTMALANFAGLRGNDRVMDLGCGSGALGLLLAGREESIAYTGIDCDAAACSLALRNLARTGIGATVLCVRIEELPADSADLVISNPPYFPDGDGIAARTGCSLEELVSAAARSLRNGGRFALVYPADRLTDLLVMLRSAQLEPKRLRLMAHKPDSAPKRVLVEAVKGGHPGMNVLPCLFWHTEDEKRSAEYLRIYHESEET